jgi:hypothetical protein
MTPSELALAAVKIADHYDDDALIYVKDDRLYVDVDRVWPDCTSPTAVCEGSGEYRAVAIIDMFKGQITWLNPMHQGHDDA